MIKKKGENKKKDKNSQKGIKFPANLLKAIGRFLYQEEQKVLKKLQSLKKEDPFSNSSRLNDNASPSAEAEEQFGHMKNQAIQKELKRKLIQVRKALSRVKIGSYGNCEVCGKMINTDRLIVYPETTICISCLKKREMANKKK